MPERRQAALLSLSDTTGAAELAHALVERGYELLATTGTRDFLERNEIAARDVESVTGFAPLFDGRVKTLHPLIFGGILYDRDSSQQRDEAERRGIPAISTVAVTLYPPPEIDIGGVALLRAAAKNHAHVSVLCDPAQYGAFVQALRNGGPTLEQRRAFAAAALLHTAAYDEGIAARMSQRERLRYGENPHQSATFVPGALPLPEKLHGKALSYNNLLDLDAALGLLARVSELRSDPGVRAAIVKHTIPCGVAQHADVARALSLALDADRTSAYGGIVAVDAPLGVAAARALSGTFIELVAAPAFDDGALAILRERKNLRVMRFDPELPHRIGQEGSVRSALGGTLLQSTRAESVSEEMRVVSKREPSDSQWRDLLFAWDVVRHVKSNGIVIAAGGVTGGICAGQTNRVSAVEIAVARAGERAAGAACASDGFFPFKDGLEAAISGGCSVVIAPGGSIRDGEVIAAADAAGVALVFSSRRYFLH